MIADTLDRVLCDVLTAPARGGEFKQERWLARLPPEDRELVEPLLAEQDERPPLPVAPSDRVRRLALRVADTPIGLRDLRRNAGLDEPAFVDRLAGALGMGDVKRLGARYGDLERRRIPGTRLRPRLVQAMAQVLGTSADAVRVAAGGTPMTGRMLARRDESVDRHPIDALFLDGPW